MSGTPPTITIFRARGAPGQDPGTNFRMLIIGTSSKYPGSTVGKIFGPYYQVSALVEDFGIGDGVDAACHALTPTDDNPTPPGVWFMSTKDMAGLTPGVRGAVNDDGVTGTCTVTATANKTPEGTYEPKVRVKDDGNNGAGAAVGTAGIILEASLDHGRTWLPPHALGTDTSYEIAIPNPGASPFLTGCSYDFSSGDTLITGDVIVESKTKPPQWDDSDIYTAGSPGSGALVTVAMSQHDFGMVVLTEPFTDTDVAVVSAGLTQAKVLKGTARITVIGRVRDQDPAESDADWLTYLATFRGACADEDDIHLVSGDGWLTDALRSYIYSRSGLPALLARIQGHNAIPGAKGERVAQAPGWAKRGPLPGFTIVDPDDNPVGHNERVRGGALQPVSGKGGFGAFYHESATGRQGTYYCVDAPTLYGVGSRVLELMDSRVSNGIERALYGVSFDALGGADVVTGGVLDQDTRDAMASAGMRVIVEGYSNEIANANDPNLVTVDPNVTTDGAMDTVRWYVNDRLFTYVNGIVIQIANARG
jgi:hypothetical protein